MINNKTVIDYFITLFKKKIRRHDMILNFITDRQLMTEGKSLEYEDLSVAVFPNQYEVI